MLTDLHLGNYASTVVELNKRLKAFVLQGRGLKVVVVGHGGRDCWISLLLVQAVASDPLLREAVQIDILSCTWPGDGWENSMVEYLGPFTDFVYFVQFQFHRDHHILVQDLRLRYQRADIILQCEQGVDYFVPPGRLGKHVLAAPFLQDNYEDWIMLFEGLRYVRTKTHCQMWLLETNPDLDMGKGISRLELQQAVFGQQLKCEAFQQCLQGSDAPRVIDVAVKLGRSTIEQRKEVSKSLDIELRQLGHDCANRVYNGIYQDFTCFCLNRPDSPAVPVASVLELLSKLIKNNAIMLKDSEELPECEWILARHLKPQDVRVGDLRVWSDLDSIISSLPENPSTAQWIHELLWFRRHKSPDDESLSSIAPPAEANEMVGERARGEMVEDLSIALCVAESILFQCPKFDLWKHRELLLRCLQRMGTHSSDMHHQGMLNGSPSIFLFLRSNPLQTLDFLCRFLELPKPQEASAYISQHFLDGKYLHEDVSRSWMWPAFQLLQTYLVEEWNKLHQ